jgi:hypothetical protein
MVGLHSFAQTDSTTNSELPTPITLPDDSLNTALPAINDTLATDSVIQLSKDQINASIFYDAEDSAIYDAINQRVILYGKAIVKYEKIVLQADYITYSFEDNAVFATGLPDSTGNLVGLPIFKEGDQEFRPKSVSYNFRSRKGYIEEVITQQGEFYLHSQQTKRQPNEWIHLKNGKFTTCDKENPHYHFHLTKAIVIPDDKIVSGPVYLKVRKVPTPLALPFGFFPNKRESSQGIILPAYGNGGNLGYFFRDGGYYLPLGPHADTRFLADIYTRGSWTVRNITAYKRRYKYSGNFNVSRSVLKRGLQEIPGYTENTEFFLRWQHSQDPKARPNTSFSADINAGSRNNFTNNINSSQTDYLSNTFQSNVRWNKSWAGKPFNLSANFRHSQNSQTRNVDLTLPALAFTVSRFYLPLGFINKNNPKKSWYENIGVNYSANFDNRITAKDSEFRFDNLDYLSGRMRNGIRHSLNATTSLKAGYVSINPSFNLTDRWYFDYLQVDLDPETLLSRSDTLRGFRNAPDWSLSVNANTKIYGTFNTSRTGAIRAIRHVITPSAGFAFRPDMGTEKFGYFGDGGSYTSYSPFDIGIYGKPNSIRSGSATFSLQNNLEAKVRDKKNGKSGQSKISIIDNFRIGSSYDFFRDSVNFSNINMDGFTTIYKNINLNYSSVHSLYDRDSSGRLIDQFLLREGKGLMRMTTTALALNMNLRSANRNSAGTRPENLTEEEQEEINRKPEEFVDFSVPWNLNIAYSMRLNKVFDTVQLADTNAITQSVLFNGDLTIYKNWKIGFNSGYDFTAEEFTPTTLNLYWDLHCWELSVDYIPFGFRKSYAVQLNIKASALKDLKLQRRRNLGQSNLLL